MEQYNQRRKRPTRSQVRAVRAAWHAALPGGDMAKRKTASGPKTDAPAYNPFLKPEHLGRGPTTLTLTGWTRRIVGKFGPQIVIEVIDERQKTYDFAIGVGSPNHRILFKTMGNDESRWRGSITVEKRAGRNAPFVSVLETSSDDAPF